MTIRKTSPSSVRQLLNAARIAGTPARTVGVRNTSPANAASRFAGGIVGEGEADDIHPDWRQQPRGGDAGDRPPQGEGAGDVSFDDLAVPLPAVGPQSEQAASAQRRWEFSGVRWTRSGLSPSGPR